MMTQTIDAVVNAVGDFCLFVFSTKLCRHSGPYGGYQGNQFGAFSSFEEAAKFLDERGFVWVNDKWIRPCEKDPAYPIYYYWKIVQWSKECPYQGGPPYGEESVRNWKEGGGVNYWGVKEALQRGIIHEEKRAQNIPVCIFESHLLLPIWSIPEWMLYPEIRRTKELLESNSRDEISATAEIEQGEALIRRGKERLQIAQQARLQLEKDLQIAEATVIPLPPK